MIDVTYDVIMIQWGSSLDNWILDTDMAARTQGSATACTARHGVRDFEIQWISEWISGFQSGFLDFKVDFLISKWISGFQFGSLPTVYEISFVTDPSART